MQQTLVMLHGLTGSQSLMLPFASKICPDGCELFVPDAPFKHEKRGFCWWNYKSDTKVKPQKIKITEKLLVEIQKSIDYLVENIPKEGKVILGGFSQGAVMAQIMLLSSISKRISGLVLLGTRSIEERRLRDALKSLKPIPVLWMHGLKDEIIDFDDSIDLANIIEDEGWNVTKIIHEKGHVIPLGEHKKIIDFVNEIFLDNT